VPIGPLFSVVGGSWEVRVADDSEPIICVVDDDEAVRDSLKLLLESHGMAVSDYASTEEFARTPVVGRKACLILDQHLPGTSGLDFLAAQDGALAELPVIMITGRGDLALRARAEQLGVRAFLDKPVTEEPLLASIRQVLGMA
jgi:FixJ family two-component response regulator